MRKELVVTLGTVFVLGLLKFGGAMSRRSLAGLDIASSVFNYIQS